MKKFFYISIGVIVGLILIIVILSSFATKVKVSDESDLISRFNNKDTFLLVIGESTCSHCADYKAVTLLQYEKSKPGTPLYFTYSDTSFANSTRFNSFITTYITSAGKVYEGSPTTYYVKKGKVVDSVEGDISLAELNNFILKNS